MFIAGLVSCLSQPVKKSEKPIDRTPETVKPQVRTPANTVTETAKTQAAPADTNAEKLVIDFGDFSANLHKMMKLIESRDYFKILGVTKTSSKQEIKKAYFQLAKIYHPDSVRNISRDSERELIGKIFVSINEAYDVISTPAKRHKYENESSSPQTKKYDPESNAKEFFEQGNSMFQRGMIKEAVEYYKRAAFIVSDNPEYLH